MTSDLQRQKYTKAFERFDVDGDGQIEQTDIDALVQGWAHDLGVPPKTPVWRILVRLSNRMWQDIRGHFDRNGNKRVNLEEWLAAHEDPDFIKNIALPFGVAAFDLADADRDGKVSLNEWTTAQTVSGLSQAEALASFQQLDGDADGYVTKEEYIKATEEFYRSTDRAAVGNELAGRI